MTTGTSLWATSAIKQLSDSADKPLHRHSAGGLPFEVKVLGDSLWVTSSFDGRNHMAFRAAYSPDGFNKIEVDNNETNAISINLVSAIGDYKVSINWPQQEQPILHFTTSLNLACNSFIPFWPRDIIAYGKNEPAGEIHIAQTGTRSGLLYSSFKEPAAGCFLYLQNLTALSAYNMDTETSAGGIVGGQWPEMGLSLPPTKDKPLQKGKTYVVSDVFVAFSKQSPTDQFEIAKGFLEALANLYLLLPRPETAYQDYLGVLPKALYDLQTNKGCWSHRSGHPYLNAYLCDYQTPPEIMVQLAVLLPLQDYMRWSGETCTIAQEISDGLSAFYDEQLGTVMRWLPAEEHRLDKSEEQKTPKVMDAWYLHHPLLNLARMAQAGDDLAKQLLLKSVDYAIKVAQHFNYCWPVFYQMDTLEVLKAETKPGEGGEKDVAGLYAHVMLQVWEITKEQKYFKEAEKAAQSLPQHGFNVFYQANNTMFSAKAMILLYKETKKELYRDLSYLFLANIFKNVALWECTYGFGKNFPTFFELFPLNDAPYTAVYEEQEAYAGVHEFLNYAQGVELLPAVNLLIAEFARYAVHRMIYYYPPMLPQEMLAKEAKTGELDPKLWVALEDIHDGWEQSGGVGQEVYGAGLAFGIVPRQYIRIPGHDFMVFVDYPVLNQKISGKSLHFDIKGDERLTCSLRIIKQGKKQLPTIKIKAGNTADQKHLNDIKQLKEGIEYKLHGNQQVSISWE
ncbi:hypothetical protein AB6735_06695 [Mucilaginibacter sp. RCC_168]|uniref:hypothetical protein n=1 Tax=Mucilaginibacter sp. RCC_168 TaxID=3239221 RepID=UPI0035239620